MKLDAIKAGMFIQASNDDITLFGGMRSGSSDSSTTRLKFEVFSNSIYDHLQKTSPNMSQDDLAKESKVGVCEIFVKDGTLFEFDTLVNLEITRKRKGYGTQVVQALRDTVDGDFTVRDIQSGRAAKFWVSQGVKLDRPIKNLSSKESFKGGVNGTIPKDHVAKVRVKESTLEV